MKKILLIMLLLSFNVLAKPVNVNTADAKAISESLKGIGQKKAEEIVRYRTENGPFKTKMDLINVKGIGEKTVKKNEKDILISTENGDKKLSKEKKKK